MKPRLGAEKGVCIGQAAGGQPALRHISRAGLAAVLTNDTNLVEPVRIVTQELGLPVTLLSPSGQPAGALINAATSLRHVRPYEWVSWLAGT
jgi:hypothetical protein